MGALWAIGAGTVIFAAVVGYAITRRYGWGLAVMLPVLAWLAMFAMRWQREGLSLSEGMGQLGPMLMFSAPILLGSLIGIALARLKRG